MLQRLLPGGGRVASVMTRATFAAAIEALRPRPGRSVRPSMPDLAKRPDHVETRCGVHPFGDGFDTEAVEPKQDDVGALAIPQADRGRLRPASEFTHNAGLSLQSLDRSCHPIVPDGSPTRGILVDI